MKRSTGLIVCLILMALQAANAQNRTITGKVSSSEDGQGLAGVSVAIPGTSLGTITDAEGAYSLDVNQADAVLVFSFVGMVSQEIPVGNQTVIDVILQPDNVALDEVVVTALGISREKKALGYSVQDVSGAELAESGEVNVLNSLAGRVAGISTTSATGSMGGSTRILIRGANSVTGNNSPLFVVDGIPFDNSEFNTYDTQRGAGGYDYGSMIQDLDPNDIESISVLKGPSAAAIYGSRAANGVILVNTKRGESRKGIGVSLNSGVAIEQVALLPRYQNTYGGGGMNLFGGSDFYTTANIDGTEYKVTDFSVDESWGPKYDGQMVLQWDAFDEWDTENYLVPREWRAPDADVIDFFETGLSFTNNVAFDGGNENARFRVSYTNMTLDGYMPNSSLDRNTVSFNGSTRLGKSLEAFGTITYVRNKAVGRPSTGYDGNNVMQKFNQWGQRQLDMDRLRNYKNPDGSQRTWNRVAWDDPTPNFADNPYWTRYENYQEDWRDRYFGNVGLIWSITDWLSAQVKVNQDQYAFTQKERIAIGSQAQSKYEEIHRSNLERNSEFLFMIDRQLNNDFRLNANFGGNRMYYEYHRNSAVTKGGLNIPDNFTIPNSVAPPASDQLTKKKAINSLYGSASLGYQSLLYLDFTLRNDWSSTLPDNNNSYLYYSVASSFVFTELGLFKAMDWFNFGKLRAGYALVGNDTDPYRLDNYYVQPLDSEDYYPYHYWGENALFSVPDIQNNANLKPESTRSLEFGTELRFFGNRLGVDFTWYDMSTTDQILSIRVPAGTGYKKKVLNAGEITNRGVELMLHLVPLKLKNSFNWEIIANFSRNRNEVVELAPGLDNYYLAGGPFNVSVNATVGERYGALRATDFIYDADGNRVVGSDGLYLHSGIQVVGHALPDWTAGITNIFSFKGFDLSFLIDIRQGGEYFSTTHMWGMYSGILEASATPTSDGNTIREDGIILEGMAAAYDNDGHVIYNEDGTAQVTGVNDVNTYAILWAWDHYSGADTQNIFDATYIKLRDVRLGYTFPAGIGPFQNIRLSAYGKNLAIWGTDERNPHVDPENTTSAENIQGIEGGAMPSMRTFGLNLSLKF